MSKTPIFICILWCLTAANGFATDLSEVKLEGVSLKMTVAEAKKALLSRGYAPYTEQRSDIERMKSVMFVKDTHYSILLAADHFIDSDMTKPGADELTITQVRYSEAANVLGARKPTESYLCPLGLEFYGRYCPEAGDGACYENDGYRKVEFEPKRNERKLHATISLSLQVESHALCIIDLYTHRADNIRSTFEYQRMDTSFLPN